MNLLEAIREAIFLAKWKYKDGVPSALLRELIASAIVHGEEANWDKSCLAEVYTEFPWIPSQNFENNSGEWERIGVILNRLGFNVYCDPYNMAVMTIQPSVWPQDTDYPSVEPNIHERFLESATQHSRKVVEKVENDIHIRGISSPIEQLFYLEWCLAIAERNYADIRGYHLIPQYAFKEHGLEWSDKVLYKVDFAVQEVASDYELSHLRIAIECDGYAYHERSKGQFEYEKERERYLQSLGWRLIRFAGTEITRNPRKCALEVLDLLDEERIERAKRSYSKAQIRL